MGLSSIYLKNLACQCSKKNSGGGGSGWYKRMQSFGQIVNNSIRKEYFAISVQFENRCGLYHSYNPTNNAARMVR